MEKSYHEAKAAAQDHSQHGGKEARRSIITQQYEWWCRCIQHRYARRERLKREEAQRGPPDMVALAAAAKHRDAWHASTAASSLEDWRKGRKREGKRWVVVDGGIDESTEMGGSAMGGVSSNVQQLNGSNGEMNSTQATEEAGMTQRSEDAE